jgi:hypothetical protein
MSADPDPDRTADAVPSDPETVQTTGNERWPVGFMLTIVMVSLYVGYRLIQLTVKFFQWLF